ncbi:MAG TPA: hypothetical protein VEF35_03780 [Candidatus Bathyarchaeia archaeon]|nr:hypothetical protein [Candidatus Bathyarchaeia archaeon]
MIVAAVLCFSVVGLAAIHPAAATAVNTSAPASGESGQPTPYEMSSNTPSAQTQPTSTIADLQSQTLTIPLVPSQLIVANQTVSEPTSSSTSATVGASQAGGAASVEPTADTAAGNAANPAEVVTTNVTQPAADNGSLAPIPVSAGGGGSGLILVISLSYGTAIVVLALMRYWSFSFDEAAESPPDLIAEDVVYVRGSAYSTLESTLYGYIPKGP